MKEKKVIDYTRTYRRIEADKKKCILYIVILLLLGFLLMWTQIDDLTRIICKICAGILKKYEPHMYVGIRSEAYPLFGKISYFCSSFHSGRGGFPIETDHAHAVSGDSGWRHYFYRP